MHARTRSVRLTVIRIRIGRRSPSQTSSRVQALLGLGNVRRLPSVRTHQGPVGSRAPSWAYWDGGLVEMPAERTEVIKTSIRSRLISFLWAYSYLAVRVGFEPTEPAKVQRFSRPPDSTALAPHRHFQSSGFKGLKQLSACGPVSPRSRTTLELAPLQGAARGRGRALYGIRY